MLDLLRLRRHYAANVSMIDEQVGRILAALDARGYLDNALVIFTSDHADALGEHGHIQKWTMYDCSVRVPLIIWSRNRLGCKRNDSLVQLMDIAPTVLKYFGVAIPKGARLDARATASLEAAIRSQIAPCWNPPIGGADVKKMTVVLRIELQRDGSVIGRPTVVSQTGATAGNADYARAFARLENHYFQNAGFLECDGWILREKKRITHIPAVIVQGRYDMICPATTAPGPAPAGRAGCWR